MNSQSRLALVTGGSSGIGAAIAKHLSSSGVTVLLTYKTNRTGAEQVRDAITAAGGSVLIHQLDVTDESSVRLLSEELAYKFEALDILVNNAGSDKLAPLESCSFEDWQQITRPKIDGNFLCTKYFLPLLKKSENPNIIVVSSSIELNPDPEDPAYSIGAVAATRFGLIMAVALGKYRIRTNVIAPGSIETNLEYWRAQNDPQLWTAIARKNPLGRTCRMDDIMHVIDFIVSEQSSFVNGNVFYVSGGAHLTG